MSDLKAQAKRAITLLDLTNLNDVCTAADIDDLARRAVTPHGKVAALCIWPQWIKRAKEAVADREIRIAAVANFPKGSVDAATAARETARAIADGADEVDVVLPYEALLAGNPGAAAKLVAAVRREVPSPHRLKIIIESGVLASRGHILLASNIALAAGADFIKTSTGKGAVNATLFAAEIMLGAIQRGGFNAGFKAAGGIKTAQDVASYLALADTMMGPGWATPATFRFGASGVLASLVAAIEGLTAASSSGY
jgi:deoxyribose-phosphate aldolase